MLWDKLVDIIYDRWKGKPRRDLVRAVVLLRDNMGSCHDSYERFDKARRGDFSGYDDPVSNEDERMWALDDLRQDWGGALDRLGLDIVRLDDVLSIFSPEAHELIAQYYYAEVTALKGEALSAAAETLGESPGFDVEGGELALQDFSAARRRLDEFIRSHFAPEEIANATQWARDLGLVWRAWS